MAGGGLRYPSAAALVVALVASALLLGIVALGDTGVDHLGLVVVLVVVVVGWVHAAAGWLTEVDPSIPGLRWAIERRTVRLALAIVGVGGLVSHWFDLTTAAWMIARSGLAVEANPIVRLLADSAGGWGLVAGKVVLALVVVLSVVTLWQTRTRRADALALGITAAFLAAGMLGAWSNARVLAIVF